MQVLQRKTEEAAMATKRLKELLEARKSSGRDNSGMNGTSPGSHMTEKSLQKWLEQDLEVMVHVHEVRNEYEKQSQLYVIHFISFPNVNYRDHSSCNA
jgi:hypothetical protein